MNVNIQRDFTLISEMLQQRPVSLRFLFNTKHNFS